MNKIFKRISLKNEDSFYPKKKGFYTTSFGELRFEDGHWWGGRGWVYPDWWEMEIKLPSEKEIVKHYTTKDGYVEMEEQIEGAKWYRKLVLAVVPK